MDHIEPVFAAAARRVPALESAGVQVFFNGPESFTPDDRYLLGESPEVAGLFVAAGFNSIGIQSAGGAGKVLADWIVDGHAPIDLWDVDIRRCAPFQRNRRYLHDRTVESLGLLYAMHWPFRQYESARDVRKSCLHDRLARAGACFGEVAGYERPNWFAPEGVEPRYDYSYGRQNWFEYSGAEHRAVREAVGLFDQSSFAKFVLQGRDAASVLSRMCANDVQVEPGRIVYTQWLNERGGIEADLTVTREAARSVPHCQLLRHADARLRLAVAQHSAEAHALALDVSSAYAVLGLMGPNSRELLSTLTDADLATEAFPFGTSRMIDLAYARVRASRITYVGELGYELYIPTEFAQSVFDAIVAAGRAFGLRLAGYHALNSLRMEKGYRHWGHDIGDEDSPLEAGLAFAVAWDKPGGFIGRDALLRAARAGSGASPGVDRARGSRSFCSITTSRSGATASGSGASAQGCSGTRSEPRSGSGMSRAVRRRWMPPGSPPGATRWRLPPSAYRRAYRRGPFTTRAASASGSSLERWHALADQSGGHRRRRRRHECAVSPDPSGLDRRGAA